MLDELLNRLTRALLVTVNVLTRFCTHYKAFLSVQLSFYHFWIIYLHFLYHFLIVFVYFDNFFSHLDNCYLSFRDFEHYQQCHICMDGLNIL